MIIKNVNLETVCGITSAIQDNLLDEVAFAGKSNVGKSSLINALMNRKSLARTSSQPGKTQTINFYNVNEAMYLVDLPGYGYANANIEIKAKWGQMIENYLHTSKRLKAVFLLIDIRHEPSENDQMMYEWMVHQGFAPIIIATKSDKLKKMQILQHVQMIKDILQVEPGTIVIPFSAESKQGREEIWQSVESVIELPQVYIEAENAKREAKQKQPAPQEPKKKERWKKTDRPVAKKTLRKEQKKEVTTVSSCPSVCSCVWLTYHPVSPIPSTRMAKSMIAVYKYFFFILLFFHFLFLFFSKCLFGYRAVCLFPAFFFLRFLRCRLRM